MEKNVTMKNWTTWEELLLACAVKRHGFHDWNTVAMEIKSRITSLPHDLITAFNCKLKYLHLKRRYTSSAAATASAAVGELIENDDTLDTVENDDDVDVDLPWIEQLRNLRVAELRQEVHRYDDSILSLQLKVKKLEEEREQSSIKSNDDDEKTDLDKFKVSETTSPAKIDCNLAADDVLHRRDESVNGSNSTSVKGETKYSGLKHEDELRDESVRSGLIKPDLEMLEPAVGCDSLGDGSEVSMAKDSYDVRESVNEWSRLVDEETRDSSNVQSAANLTRRSRRRENAGGGRKVPGTLTVSGAISEIVRQHLVGVVELIRSHRHGYLFEHRLKSQENDKYDNIVRQHMDLQTIEKRVEQGYYSSCTSKFHRDLLLLFNNTIVYFPKSSVEYISAVELRNLVSNEISKQAQRSCSSEPSLSLFVQPGSKPNTKRPESSLLAKRKSSNPIVVCRKRSSISSKGNGTQSAETKSGIDVSPSTAKSSEDLVLPEQEQSSVKNNSDYTVTGTRSLRRNKSSLKNSGDTPIFKKKEASTKKRGGAADFLKRGKESSSLEKSKSATSNTRITRQSDAKSGGGGGGGKKNRRNEKKEGRQDRVVSRSKQVADKGSNPVERNLRKRLPRKMVDSAPVKRKRETETSASKQPQKRSRR